MDMTDKQFLLKVADTFDSAEYDDNGEAKIAKELVKILSQRFRKIANAMAEKQYGSHKAVNVEDVKGLIDGNLDAEKATEITMWMLRELSAGNQNAVKEIMQYVENKIKN